MPHTITIIHESWLKSSPTASEGLKPGSQKVKLVPGKKLIAASIYMDKGQHARVTFEPALEVTLSGVKVSWIEGYIFAPHIQGISTYAATVAKSSGKATIPDNRYFLHASAATLQQNNNKDWGDDNLRYGAVQCGLTSVAQLLTAVWPWDKIRQLVRETPSGQFEDWVGGQFKRLGAQSTSMEGHVEVLTALGIPCKAYRNRSISQLKEDLRFTPVVLGMAYKSSGHFVTAVGYCDNPPDTIKQASPVGTIDNLVTSGTKITASGIIYNDPYGHRNWSGSANNWHSIAQDSNDASGLHNFCSDADMAVFWADNSGDNSGWCVVPDRSTKLLGGKGQPPSVAVGLPRKFKPQELRLNSRAIAIVEHFEGLELHQYYCSANVSTIGYGSTRWHGGEPIPVGATVTKEQAIALFRRDATEFISAIARCIDIPVTASQAAALFSFTYNCGIGALEESTLRKVINSGGSDGAVVEQLRRWAKADGQTLPGLLRRRNAEGMLWSGSLEWRKATFD